MNCLTWNLQWARPNTPRGEQILVGIKAMNPDVVCYTEVIKDFVPVGHQIEADSDYGYTHNGTRRKVILWSKHPWEDIDVIGDSAMPSGRFVSGVSLGIRFVGVCIPWSDAHVTTGRKNRARWEDHILYCNGLGKILRRYAESDLPICVLGDFNQQIPRYRQPVRVTEALASAFSSDFKIATEGMTDANGHGLIDHIAVTAGLNISVTKILPRFAEDSTRLSDHVGVSASLTVG